MTEDERNDRNAIIRAMVEDQYDSDEVEVDEASDGVSEGDDNGAFVRAWVWVSFADTPLDKDTIEAREAELDAEAAATPGAGIDPL